MWIGLIVAFVLVVMTSYVIQSHSTARKLKTALEKEREARRVLIELAQKRLTEGELWRYMYEKERRFRDAVKYLSYNLHTSEMTLYRLSEEQRQNLEARERDTMIRRIAEELKPFVEFRVERDMPTFNTVTTARLLLVDPEKLKQIENGGY